MGYITQQRRLFVGLACSYAYHVAMLQLKNIVVQVRAPRAGCAGRCSGGAGSCVAWGSHYASKCRSLPHAPLLPLQGGPDAAKQVHVISSGLKAGATWQRKRILNDARECCGGMGFMAANKIGCGQGCWGQCFGARYFGGGARCHVAGP